MTVLDTPAAPSTEEPIKAAVLVRLLYIVDVQVAVWQHVSAHTSMVPYAWPAAFVPFGAPSSPACWPPCGVPPYRLRAAQRDEDALLLAGMTS